MKQGVALTERNYTGPPWSVTDDDRRRQTPESTTSLAHFSGSLTMRYGSTPTNLYTTIDKILNEWNPTSKIKLAPSMTLRKL